ncbi:DUF86 domain-containing protein [Pleurocapsa sp. PCC 7319]|uniref:HepT-like ribonuclease domain-containing protein n=1 Tax=Pleurocapsa sp. PCC 7319 TaxID=118161 RepID=UPI00034BED8B|nr:HepT-like ribonuclease domain-containing protein [Pleurocapsa sp. PCC 7319]
MLLSAKIVVGYVEERSRTDLESDLQLQDAVVRRLLIIGEASNRVSKITQNNLQKIPWRFINGMRNRLVHEDDDIDFDIVWDTLQKSLPALIIELEKIIS